MTDDERTNAEGQAEQAAGKAQQRLADVKEKADETVKKVTHLDD